jgi:hypothetical protein
MHGSKLDARLMWFTGFLVAAGADAMAVNDVTHRILLGNQ